MNATRIETTPLALSPIVNPEPKTTNSDEKKDKSAARRARSTVARPPLAGARLEPLLTRSDRKSTRLNSSHIPLSRMPSSA